MHQYPLPLHELHALAPEALPNLRTDRYLGNNQSAPLSAFSPRDQELLQGIYQALLPLLDELRVFRTPPDGGARTPIPPGQHQKWNRQGRELIGMARELGMASAGIYGPDLKRVLHDMRGGAMTSLSLKLTMCSEKSTTQDEIDSLCYLTRDHLKMMRNALSDIDPARREKDERAQEHDIALLAEKWSQASHHAGGSKARVAFFTTYQGPVAERCLEFSALDRIVYNLINNATRFAADNQVHFAVLPFGAAPDLRFVVANRVSSAHAEAIRANFGAHPETIFEGGFTTGGSGHGLRICAEFVQSAFGLPDVTSAIREKYIGAAIRDDWWLSWFHWPAVD